MISVLILGNSDVIKRLYNLINSYIVESYYDDKMTINLQDGIECLYDTTSKFDLLFIDETCKNQLLNSIGHFSSLVEQIEKNNAVTIVVSNDNAIPINLIKLNIRDWIAPKHLENQIYSAIDNYLLGTFSKYNFFHYRIHRSNHLVNTKQILFFQSEGKRIIIQTKQGTEYFYGQLSSCQEQICIRSFVLIHQSYLVNPLYIDEIKERKVYIGNYILPISRKHLENVRRELFDKWL